MRSRRATGSSFHSIMRKLDDIIRPEVRALRAYHVHDATGMIKLDAMENPYGLPREQAAMLADALAGVALNRYPDAQAAALKRALRRRFAIDERYELVIGNGSDELILLFALLVNRPAAAMLGVEPSFVMYRMISTYVGMRYASVDLNPDFGLPRESLIRAIEREQPALMFLAYPNNPTGNCYSADDLDAVLDAASGIVVIDEAYFPFSQRSLADRLARHPHLVIMRTLSKLGLAGLRLGFAFGHRELINEVEKLRLPYNVNSLSQRAAVHALEQFAALAAQNEQIRADRETLQRALAALPGVKCYPSEANFILIRVADATAVHNRLLEAGILVKNLNGGHALLHNCLRITVGSRAENAALIAALTNAIETQA